MTLDNLFFILHAVLQVIHVVVSLITVFAMLYYIMRPEINQALYPNVKYETVGDDDKKSGDSSDYTSDQEGDDYDDAEKKEETKDKDEEIKEEEKNDVNNTVTREEKV